VLRTAAFTTGFVTFLYIVTSCVEGSDLQTYRGRSYNLYYPIIALSAEESALRNTEKRLISPIGAAARSIVPGWGQVYTRDKLEGVFIFLSIGILGSGGVRADAIYRHFYNDKYRPAVLADSTKADFYFDRSNQYYKLSRFLLYTAAGIWAYSIIDAYVDAHIYNARQQVEMLDIDDEMLRQLKLRDTQYSIKQAEAFYLSIQYPSFLKNPRVRGDQSKNFPQIVTVWGFSKGLPISSIQHREPR